MDFISEINEEQGALCGSVKLAARHPFFSIKVTAFMIVLGILVLAAQTCQLHA